ncbi:NTP transferase domain-containing protein [Streptomyces sp. NPDC046465]|uniref:NTP transferase domain-containing protein n=1 Tax=Streptomyces sp. NPDC046465 TaxID=3155810 RepID=UPI0034089136
MTTNEGDPPEPAAPYDAVVLAGGGAARLGGADKPGVRVGGRTLIDRVLAACSGAGTTVVVAAPRPTARPVVWAREEPAGGGPLAALAAGLRCTSAERVVVLSADLPFLGERTVRRLLTALGESGADGVVLTDPDGRDQPLVAAYRRDALCREIAGLAGLAGLTGLAGLAEERERARALTGLPLRLLVARLELSRVADPVAAFDCDTWDDIATARARIREHGHVLDEWISAVKDELGIDLDVDTGALLDLARDAAHGVARPAAPLTTFLVGYAAAQAAARGGTADGTEAVAEATRKAAALAARWTDEDQPDEGQPDEGQQDVKPQAASHAPTDTATDAPTDAPADDSPRTRPDAG